MIFDKSSGGKEFRQRPESDSNVTVQKSHSLNPLHVPSPYGLTPAGNEGS